MRRGKPLRFLCEFMTEKNQSDKIFNGDTIIGGKGSDYNPHNPHHLTGGSGTDVISFGTPVAAQDFWNYDGISLTGNPNTAPDTITFNINMSEETNKNGFWKYEEDKTLKQVEEYLVSTYKSHYTSEQSKTQTLDLIESIGDAEAFTRSNAIKYLSRFGKKNGKSKMDILKAIHYCILLYHFAGLHKNTNNNYPY